MKRMIALILALIFLSAACASAYPAGSSVEEMFLEGMEFFNRGDYDRAFARFQISGEVKGYAPSQNMLGICYRDGLGAKQDLTEAERYFRLALEQGYSPAKVNLDAMAGEDAEELNRIISVVCKNTDTATEESIHVQYTVSEKVAEAGYYVGIAFSTDVENLFIDEYGNAPDADLWFWETDGLLHDFSDKQSISAIRVLDQLVPGNTYFIKAVIKSQDRKISATEAIGFDVSGEVSAISLDIPVSLLKHAHSAFEFKPPFTGTYAVTSTGSAPEFVTIYDRNGSLITGGSDLAEYGLSFAVDEDQEVIYIFTRSEENDTPLVIKNLVPGYDSEPAMESTAMTDYSASPGEIITFGSYEQDNDFSNGPEPIEWIVLDVQDGKALLLSRYALASRNYNDTFKSGITWENCDLRQWLNGDFLSEAFNAEEGARISLSSVSADKNPKFNTDPGNSTHDKVFLLGKSDVDNYFSSDKEKVCVPSDYAVSQKIVRINGNCFWWLRSPGVVDGFITTVNPLGSSEENGNRISEPAAVRPAIWISIDGNFDQTGA